MILAVIPARGGSKRLPRKNIVPFGGKPLLLWSIETALATPGVGPCIVSTEDPEIGMIARRAGAIIVDRPPALASDEASSVDVLIHATGAAAQAGYTFDGVLLLQPTNPLRPIDMMRRAIERFMTEPCDSLIAVSRRRLKLGWVKDGYYKPDYAFGTQSRLVPPVVYENGLFYLTKRDILIRDGSLTGTSVLAFETERPFDDVDIDEPIDLVIAEAILATIHDRLDTGKR
jgi:CMP-N,N'-diacetyllegionaminic acid synthase